MRKAAKANLPPWKKPGRILWFISALIFSAYIMVHMPASVKSSATAKQEPFTEQPAQNTISAMKQNSHASVAKQDSAKTQSLSPAKQEISAFQKIITKLQSFTRIFMAVAIAAFIGAVIELRGWHLFLAKIMGRLTHFARLPEIVGLAMPTALVSSAAANTMLVSSHAEGNIRTSALIAGGMANSYLSYISHSLRVIIPVVLTIGIPGILFFSVQFSGGLLVILTVFAWNRWHIDHGHSEKHPIIPQSIHFIVTPWNITVRKAIMRSLSLVFRLICITVPLMLGVEWLLKIGAFDFWNTYVPASIHTFFPVEAISIVATQIGGLIQSSAVAAHLRQEGLISNAQILLAMLAASAIGNPIRSLRRNLATALAIFPYNIACIVVFSMQFSRFIIAILGVCATAFYIHTL